jgi:hypothetical protein
LAVGDDAPRDRQGFLACLAALPTMAIRDVVANAEPLTDCDRFRCVSSLGLR